MPYAIQFAESVTDHFRWLNAVAVGKKQREALRIAGREIKL